MFVNKQSIKKGYNNCVFINVLKIKITKLLNDIITKQTIITISYNFFYFSYKKSFYFCQYILYAVYNIIIMDIKSLSDGQRHTLQQFVEKLLARNKFSPNEIESFQKLVKNVRDGKNFQMIMEKFKIGNFDKELIEDNFREGNEGF